MNIFTNLTTQIMYNEKKLISKAQKGDKEAFSTLYHHYIKEIFKFFILRTNSKPVAEDLTQETFLKMLKNLNTFQHKSSFKNWLYGIAKHTLLDYYRKHYRERTTSLETIENHLSTHNDNLAVTDNPSATNESQKILQKLPENYRQILELRFLKNLSIKDTAEILNKTVSSVKVLQHRALKKALNIEKSC